MALRKTKRSRKRIDTYQAEKLRKFLLFAVIITGTLSSLIVSWV